MHLKTQVYKMNKLAERTSLKSAFTLVELAIVIVIIGLLIAGVVSGQELIRQARFRSMMKDVESYKAATVTFVGKYNCLPGDCINAYNFFKDKTCGTNTAITTGNVTGCNGNGNAALSTAEGQLFWQHLGYSNLVKGSFTGGYKNPITIGVDVPQINYGKATGISAQMANGDVNASNSCGFASCRDASPENTTGGFFESNVFIVGGTMGLTTYSTIGSIITPDEAFEFDIKFDDGIFRSGAISGHKGRQPDGSPGWCAADGTQTGNAYNSTISLKDSLVCILVFKLGI